MKCRTCGEEVEAERRWEYRHAYVRARKDTDRVTKKAAGAVFSVEGRTEIKTEYDCQIVTDELQHWADHGWELVQAVPEWSWVVVEQIYSSSPRTYPSHIVGFYCIFLRPCIASEQSR